MVSLIIIVLLIAILLWLARTCRLIFLVYHETQMLRSQACLLQVNFVVTTNVINAIAQQFDGRMSMLEQVVANDDHLKELYTRAANPKANGEQGQ